MTGTHYNAAGGGDCQSADKRISAPFRRKFYCVTEADQEVTQLLNDWDSTDKRSRWISPSLYGNVHFPGSAENLTGAIPKILNLLQEAVPVTVKDFDTA
jgi:hypothetical protein